MSAKKANMILMDEISSLSNKITEMEQQLKSEQELNIKLHKEAEEKCLTLDRLHKRAVDEQEKHKSGVAELLSESTKLEAETKAKIKALRDEEHDIANELAAIDVIINDNELLHDRLKRLVVEHVRLKQKCEEEKVVKRQKNFDLKTTMEAILREQIREFNQDQEDVAFEAIASEAEAAAAENGRLLVELQATSTKSMQLMQSHRGTLGNLVEFKLREEVQLENYRLQEKHVETLQNETDFQQIKFSRLLKLHEDVRADFEVSRSEYIRRRELLQLLQAKTKLLNDAVSKHAKLKQSVVDSIKSVVDVSLEAMRRDREHSMKSILHAAEQTMYLGKETSSNSSDKMDAFDKRNGKSVRDRLDRERKERRASSRGITTSSATTVGLAPQSGSTQSTPREEGTCVENGDGDGGDSRLWSNKHSSSYSNKVRARMNMSFSVSKKLV